MSGMSAFINSCVATVAGQAKVEPHQTRSKLRAKKLIKALADKKKILITTHRHPDPDALASAIALRWLLQKKLPGAKIALSIKGTIAGGVNDAFNRTANLDLTPWDDAKLPSYDAILLLDCQPAFAYTPLPPGIEAFAVIDHHRAPGRKLECPFCDVRSGVGATSSIIFSYFVDLGIPVPPDLAAALLFAIETDLAGAAGIPTSLDRMAISSLMLVADTTLLYQMRYVDLPQHYYSAYFNALKNANTYERLITSYIDHVESLEQPAIMADFLLRLDRVNWALVSAVHDGNLIFSLRSSENKAAAGVVARRMVRGLAGAGGGHNTKAGGYVKLNVDTPEDVDRVRGVIRKRLLNALKIKNAKPRALVAVSKNG